MRNAGSKPTSPHPFAPSPCQSGVDPRQTSPEAGRVTARGQEPLSRCVASPACRGEGSRATPTPGGPWQPPCPPSSLRGRAREVLCCILSRGMGGMPPAPCSGCIAARRGRGSPDLVPCCRSRPQPTAMPPPELSTSWAGWVSCPQPPGPGTHQGLKQHMALAHSPAGTASPSQLVAAGIEQCSR